MKYDILNMEPGNRMIRIGFGQHNNVWFVRIDFWFKGLRIYKPL